MAIVWRDGTFLDESEFQISPFDRGLCHGMSLFETLLAVNGEPRLLTEHLDRLKYGLERLNVASVSIDEEGIRSAMVALLKHNRLENGMARIRFAVSLGIGPLNQIDSGRAWAWMIASPMDQTSPSIRVTIAPWRKDKENVLRGLKVGNYAEHLIGLDMARCEGFDEMLFFNNADELCEAAMANVFLIRGGKLFTPSLDSGCLAGVTRELILKTAEANKIRCKAKPLRKSDVFKADGMFLTSSTKGPIWVAALDAKSFETHPLFSAIRKLWLEQMATGE